MNKFQKVGLAVIAASGMSFAQGSLWGTSIDDFPALQVRNDNVKACWAQYDTGSDGTDYGSICYDQSGGWWFGYRNTPNATMAADEGASVRIDGSMVPFNPGTSLTDGDQGASKIGDALVVDIHVTKGGEGDGAGFGFNHKQDKSPRWDNSPNAFLNISSKSGYCITYMLTGDPVQFVLGWDESAGTDSQYDPFYATLQPTSTPIARNLAFEGTDFKQDGWANPKIAKSEALNNAVSVKMRVKKEGQATISIYQLGWLNECNTSPVVSSGAPVNAVNLSVAGRVVSLSVQKSTAVQVINLQGAVVHTQTLTPNSFTMNLNSLPTGVYMLRAPAIGYVNKFIIK